MALRKGNNLNYILSFIKKVILICLGLVAILALLLLGVALVPSKFLWYFT